MKKFFSMLAVLMVSTAMMAQWTKPTPKSSPVATDGTVQYIYNVEAEGFLLGANDWNTRASVAVDRGYQIRITPSEVEGCYVIEDSVETQKAWKKIFAENWGSIWVDYNKQNVLMYQSWQITPMEGGVANAFEITHKFVAENDECGKLGVAEIYRSEKGNTRVWFWKEGLTYNDPEANEEEGIEAVSHPMFDGRFMTTWVAVSEEDYNVWKLATDTYKAAQTLKEHIDAAKEAYPGIDVSAAEAVYANTASTLEDIAAAELSIIEAKNNVATVDNPADITASIVAASPANNDELNANWKHVFTGNGTVGSFQINTWSVEGNPGNDGTNMVTPFIETWTGRGGILSDAKYYHNTVNVRPGVYKIVANIRIYNESEGATENSGAYLTGNFNRSALLGQEGSVQDYYNGMLYYWNNDFATYAIVGNSGKLTFGVQIENANFNWVAAKDFRVLYCGDSEEAINLVRATCEFTAPVYEEDTYATKELLAAYTNAYNAYESASDADAVKAAVDALTELADSTAANIKAYADYAKLVEGYVDAIGSGEYDYNGDLWGEFCDFIQEEMENTVEAGELTTDEIIARKKAVVEMFNEAVKNSLSDGDDCTNMIVNASFADGFNGWTKPGSGNVGNFAGLEPAVRNNMEVYENTVEIYQDIEGVPDGIYSISVKAFERPAANGNYDGTEPAKVFLYMNDFRTPVQNICADAIPEDQAEHLVNSYYSVDERYPSSAAGWDLADYLTEYGYVPNGMVGAAVAFNAGRYEQKTYGLVEGGKMRIGLTSNGQKAHWVLWADFRLTYEGKSAEAVAKVLEAILPSIEAYYDENKGEKISASVAKELGDAIYAAQLSLNDKDGDVMFDALNKLNVAYAAAQDNALEIAKIDALYDAYSAAYEYTGYNDELDDKYDSYDATFNDLLYLEYTAEELTAFIEEVNKLIDDLKEAYDQWRMENNMPDVSDASDENPMDVTDVLVNPDMSQGNADGWTLDLVNYTNKGYQANQTYTGNETTVNGEDYTPVCSQFIEVWRSGNQPIYGDIYQKVMLPAGTYTLGADIIASYQADGNAQVTGCYLFAGDSHLEVGTGNGVPEHFELTFKLEEAKNLITVGINCSSTTNANWLAADNFTLTAYGRNSAKVTNGEENAIIEVAANDKKAIYTITGVRVNSAIKPGLYIVNGKKVLVK